MGDSVKEKTAVMGGAVSSCYQLLWLCTDVQWGWDLVYHNAGQQMLLLPYHHKLTSA